MKKKKRKLEGKLEYEFYRWGVLSPQDHPEASLPDEEKSFHTAPKRKGIYAFPRGYIETFLLGMSDIRRKPDSNNNGRSFWLKDDNGRILCVSDVYLNPDNLREGIKDEIKQLLKRRGLRGKDIDTVFTGNIGDWDNYENHKVVYYTRAHKFKYSGPYIWHHLKEYGTDKPLVEKKDILDESGSWIKTTMKVWARALEKIDTLERFSSYIDFGLFGKNLRHGNPHTYPNHYSKDHYEVFIEKL